VRHRRPDLQVVEFRGNVQTRLGKLADGVAQATLLACAGLNRLELADRMTAPVPVEIMLPAVAQGAIGIETRADDVDTLGRVAPLNHVDTADCLAAERAMLAALDGSCRTPIAALAVPEGGDVWLRGQVLRPDGSESLTTERRGPRDQAAALGADAGEELRQRAGPGFFDDE
jgi:hydroxymethylbilane synthase